MPDKKAKGKIIYIRKVDKETGKMVEVPYWVEGEEIYAIEKKDEKTGDWRAPSKPSKVPNKKDQAKTPILEPTLKK